MSNLRMGLCGKLAKSIDWSTFASLDRDLSREKSYPLMNNWGPGARFSKVPVTYRAGKCLW